MNAGVVFTWAVALWRGTKCALVHRWRHHRSHPCAGIWTCSAPGCGHSGPLW